MGKWRNQPVILEIPAFCLLQKLSLLKKKKVTIGAIPDSEIKKWSEMGYDAIWLMGVWKRSREACRIACELPELKNEYQLSLGEYTDSDIIGSPYAIYDYTVDERLGTNDELLTFKNKLHAYNLLLILDFVPNHMAIDHPWVYQHPEYFVNGDENVLVERPGQFFESTRKHQKFIAYGKEGPYRSWTDTAQLDYRNKDVHDLMYEIILNISDYCDGLRCDMAMLVLKQTFLKTWGSTFGMTQDEFWESAISKLHKKHPDFFMIAEAYWNTEYELQLQGFDSVYDGVLHKRLMQKCDKEIDVNEIKLHLYASSDFQQKLIRYIENHDENRSMFTGRKRAMAAAVLALTLPGAKMIYDGQVEGFQRRLPVQLSRRFEEKTDEQVYNFYLRLLNALQDPIFHEGTWSQLSVKSASPGSDETYKNIFAHRWCCNDQYRLIIVNYSQSPSKAFIEISGLALENRNWIFKDLLGPSRYLRGGDDLKNRGFYVEIEPFSFHVFNFASGWADSKTIIKKEYGIYAMNWSPDGHYFVTAGKGQDICLWDHDKKQLRTFAEHNSVINCFAWSPDNKMLAAGSDDHTLCIWDFETGKVHKNFKEGHYDHIISVCWSKNGNELASGSVDKLINLWYLDGSNKPVILGRHNDHVNSLCYSPKDPNILASGSGDSTVRIWNTKTKELIWTFTGDDWVSRVSWSPDGSFIAASTGGGTIVIYNVKEYRTEVTLEGHTSRVLDVTFSSDGNLLATKSADGTVILWHCGKWERLLSFLVNGIYLGGVTFHPSLPIIVTRDDQDNSITFSTFDSDGLLNLPKSNSFYTNAKVVLVGETSTGKSCLARALMNEPFVPQASTHGRWVYTLDSNNVTMADGTQRTRELLLWDLAGQAEYRLVNQLHLCEVAIALVVFDSRSQTDPFAGVNYWVRALCQAQRLQKESSLQLKKILVAARCDVGGLPASKDRIDAIVKEHGFDGYFDTSAKDNKGIRELRDFIIKQVDWEKMPWVSSTILFHDMKKFIIEEKNAGHILSSIDDLWHSFDKRYSYSTNKIESRNQFETCIGRVAAQDLVQLLSFGSLVLLQPEILDSYASSIVIAAKQEPDGMGSILENEVLEGKFYIPQSVRVKDHGQERLLLIATIEELLRHEIAFKEESNSGSILVFPSQFTRNWPVAPDPPGKFANYVFNGAILNIYATLVVRLSRSGLFDKYELWRNAAIFETLSGVSYGIYLEEKDEGHAELTLFTKGNLSYDIRVQFDKFVKSHLERRALINSVYRHSIISCPVCDTVISEVAIKRRLANNHDWIFCNVCDKPPKISISERDDKLIQTKNDTTLLEKPIETIVENLEAESDKRRVKESSTMSIKGKEILDEYDVFLSYNTKNSRIVSKVTQRLQERGIRPWLDKMDIIPGQKWIKVLQNVIEDDKIKTAAVFIGDNGIGPWQDEEIEALLQVMQKKKRTIIPVILNSKCKKINLPIFLQSIHSIKYKDPQFIDRLVCGIKGEKPRSFLSKDPLIR